MVVCTYYSAPDNRIGRAVDFTTEYSTILSILVIYLRDHKCTSTLLCMHARERATSTLCGPGAAGRVRPLRTMREHLYILAMWWSRVHGRMHG
jgi:hypothetical protein